MRGHHEKWIRQCTCLAIDRDLSFFHRFQQRTLRFGTGAIDFVGQHELGEDRPRMKLKAAVSLFVDRHAKNVGGQQVTGELNALKLQSQYTCQGLREGGFPHARDIFDQQMAAWCN